MCFFCFLSSIKISLIDCSYKALKQMCCALNRYVESYGYS